MLRGEGLRLHPRLVLWQFFANDLLDAASFAGWQASDQDDFLAWERARTLPAGAPVNASPLSLRGLLHRHLASYELAKYTDCGRAFTIRRGGQRAGSMLAARRCCWT